ncbi:acireductone dioxygenase [Halomonas shantousis]
MSFLHVYHEADGEQPLLSTYDGERIAAELDAHGVRFERWSTDVTLAPDADQESVLAAFADGVARLQAEFGFAVAAVISLTPDHPDKETLRQEFLEEHRHAEDEARFFVRGEGIYYLHMDSRVYVIGCSQGDLMSVPANTPRWFDMGPNPDFLCIRMFTNTQGWVTQMTESRIASRFPRFEALTDAAA